MPWGYAVAAVGAVAAGSMSSKATKGAANSQLQGQAAATASEERMFNKSLDIQKPYREAGYDAIQGLQGLSTDQGRADALANYFGGNEYSTMSRQAEEMSARNSAATGGLRSGGSVNALMNIAPQLGQQYLSDMENRYTGVANMGMGAASQGSSQAMALGGSMGRGDVNSGDINAQNALAQSNIWGNTANTLAGIGSDYYRNGRNG
tara:strand:+ start:994 stop:1611 length:618 start_codon:yes stop_codon:yes gene_type:complete